MKSCEQAASHAPIFFAKMNFNATGRVAWEFAAPLPQTNTPPTRTLQYDGDNRLTNFNGVSIVNDANGNMTYGPLTNTTLATYSYDARNRLMSAGGQTNAYDAMNNRVSITNSAGVTKLIIDAKSSQVLMRIKPNGTTNYYVYGPGLLYETDETSSSTVMVTYHYDMRGSTVALTDSNGKVTDQVQYSAYGLTTFRAGTNDTPFLYNGRYGVQTDPTGLLYMRNRYYNPYICRFINADPSGFGGGLNMYAFADGNPISLTDPFGLGAVGDPNGYSWVSQSSENSIPNAQYTVYPNANVGPFLQAPGTPTPIPYYDPTQPAWVYQAFPNGSSLEPTVNLIAQLGFQASIAAINGTMIVLSEGAATPEVIAEEEMVTVMHFTDAATVGRIANGTGTLNAGSFVTLPSEVAGMTSSEVEMALEIDPGKGAMSTTFQTPKSNLTIPFNGPATSGQKIQFQLLNPTPPGPFVPTH